MSWSNVGEWLSQNATSGAALVGSLLTGNIPGAVAAGVSLVAGATGQTDPTKALISLQQDPATMIRLKELALKEEENIRSHIRSMAEMQFKDDQASHEATQRTIQSGDNAEDIVVRRTRPLQSWASLIASFAYVGYNQVTVQEIDVFVLGALLTLPWAYAGLRQIGKGMDSLVEMRRKK